jgi:putative transposase
VEVACDLDLHLLCIPNEGGAIVFDNQQPRPLVQRFISLARIPVRERTYIWTAEGWLYAAAVLDLYSRRIVGWSMHDSMTSQLVADALLMAVWRRGKPVALLHHSDQGSQYTSEHFQQLLKEQGITCSMSRAGEVWDNSAMESFFSSLKTERTARKVYRTREHARADVFDYIERFFNSTRRHSTVGYVSPLQFEEAIKA